MRYIIYVQMVRLSGAKFEWDCMCGEKYGKNNNETIITVKKWTKYVFILRLTTVKNKLILFDFKTINSLN